MVFLHMLIPIAAKDDHDVIGNHTGNLTGTESTIILVKGTKKYKIVISLQEENYND